MDLNDVVSSQYCESNAGNSKFLWFLLAPCPQYVYSTALQLIFMLLLLVIFIQRLVSKSSRTGAIQNKQKRVGVLFIVTLWISGLVSLGYIGLNAWILWTRIFNLQQRVWTYGIVFTIFQTLKWSVFVTIVGHEKKFAACLHPWPLRAWWILDFVACGLAATSAILRLVFKSEGNDQLMKLNDIFMLVVLPVSTFFLVLGVTGRTGIVALENLREPLLDDQPPEEVRESARSRYGEAGFFSRLTWSWFSPVLTKGYTSVLSVDDIPDLAPEDRAEKTYARFEAEWTQSKDSMRSALLKCFGKKLLANGGLGFIRVCVMYSGPIMIQRFIDYTSTAGSRSISEGYILVLILLFAKVVEVLSSHQYNFQSQRLGVLVRSTIVTSVYQKGLRLSSSSKQGHGLGEIVNYMAVDAQQLGDLMWQIHNLWMLPGQVIIAMGILYNALGLPMLAGFAVLIAVTGFNYHSTQEQQQYQVSLMKSKDSRMKVTSEVLNLMKIIKFQAWEEHFLKRIEATRNAEYGWLSKFLWALARNIIMLWMCPSLIAVVTFGICVLLKVELTPGNVFTATSTFKILQEPMVAFPQTLISISQALVSLQRLDKYMKAEELDPEAVEYVSSSPGDDCAIKVENGSFSWDTSNAKPTLQDINLDIKRCNLVTIVGTVGSGKSSLLTAVLGEVQKLSGKVTVYGSTAFVPQTAWIQNATIKDNILFGLSMHKERYKAVLNACALEQDLKILEFGDETEIGERGINLSGGQKQRIQLARAVYQDADIYLLDDVFSAVDAHTGSQLFKECIKGVLKGKTILLVTHQVEFLQGADLILVLRDGAIVQSGKYAELLEKGTDLEALVAAHHSAMESITMQNKEEVLVLEDNTEELTLSSSPHASASMLPRINSTRSPSFQKKEEAQKLKASSKLIDEEQRESGRVGWNVYKLYITKAFGWWGPIMVLFFHSGWTSTNIGSDYWLANETSKSTFNAKSFLLGYLGISLVSWVFVASSTVTSILSGMKTAQAFYLDMLRSIFRTPLSFFDTTPSGRILSRASTDQGQLDIWLIFFTDGTITAFLLMAGALFVTCQVTWPIIILLIPLAWCFIWVQAYFLATSRELTRLEAITKAPVIFHFSETLAGILTIRAFKKQSKFVELNVTRVNTNIRMDFHNYAANEWLGSRLEMLGSLVLCMSALLFVTLPSSVIKPALVGLSLSYGLSLNGALFWCVWIACMMENKMVSVERIRQYITVETEAPRVNDDYRPPSNWPSKGNISVTNLQLRYRSNTPLVLKGLTLNIEGGTKVGVVGRTGSGKSTLIQAFFRLVEPCRGQIIIDGLDIMRLGLADLRSKFGIIPQEPILFEGSIRSNVDPLGNYPDDRIWEVLRKCQLGEVIEQKGEGLDSPVLDSGENWSVGQKQLFCLGRALLKESRILFLDEATASVDSQTDLIIQKTIKEQFAISTVVSVAHRIPSVMDSDKVLVMAEGEVKEYDHPSVLLEQPSSIFAGLVREYATRSG